MNSIPNRRWFQFTLRTVLVFMAMVACFFAGWKTHDIAAYVPPETIVIDGVILEVKEGVYELSAGSDDAVAVGTRFSVFRSGTKLGEIGVIDTSPDRCEGLLIEPRATGIPRFWQQSTPPSFQKGDKVQAKISEEQRQEMRKYFARPFEALSS